MKSFRAAAAVLASWRLRLLFRCAFLLLLVAMGATVLYLLREEKQLSYDNYRSGFQKNAAQIAARLRHPTGQLALLNPQSRTTTGGALHPVLLPYSAIDFDDQAKVQQAVEMAGCLVQYKADGSLCVAIANSPWAGGFIYVAGFFGSGDLAAHATGDGDFTGAHRVRVTVAMRGTTESWIAPFEPGVVANTAAAGRTDAAFGQRGRLTGFVEDADGSHGSRPVKEFRGWLWQSARCVDGGSDADCRRRSFFSVRVPVAALRDALFQGAKPVWPPDDLDHIDVRVEVLAPGDAPPLLDSRSDGATPPFALADLGALLLPGETLDIRRHTRSGEQQVAVLGGSTDDAPRPWLPIARLIRALEVDGYDTPLRASETIVTGSGNFDLVLQGDVRSVNQSLGVVAGRVSWFVGAMLAAILLAWLVIELGIISRITELKKRAETVTSTMKEVGDIDRFDLRDLRGGDELGILATCLADLLKRVRDDAQRERIRAGQEKDMWHAVGHEIMSPLQSLLALHGADGDASQRYILRMQQAVRVLYGSASPSEAFESTRLQLQALDLGKFLANVAGNARFIDIGDVRFIAQDGLAVWVAADEYSLEDVMTHVLRNADRHRSAGTPVTLRLGVEASQAVVTIHNLGAAIDAELIDKIFEYGVSGAGDAADAGTQGHRGQGLFVARTYMAKMAGTITARNVADGVEFVLTLPLVQAPV